MKKQSAKFALNHMICPALTTRELIIGAKQLGLDAIELRNDVGGNSLTTLSQAKEIATMANGEGIKVLSVNALYPFNIWDDEREAQANTLAELAAAAGAEALVCCPLNENKFVEHSSEKTAGLEKTLTSLAKLLNSHGLHGYLEPLGFPVSSLRFKAEAVAAIKASNTQSTFGLVHDTFHHTGADEKDFFATQTGLVHCSGLTDPNISFHDMLDAHRVLVDDKDRLNNVEQIRQLLADGYDGYISFEPFSKEVWDLPNPIASVGESIEFIKTALAV